WLPAYSGQRLRAAPSPARRCHGWKGGGAMTGEKVVAAARAWLGTPYRHRASTMGAGCDCLGLLRGVWRALYGAEPAQVPPYRADRHDPGHEGALRRAAERFLAAETGEPAS